ncbi:MAG TPA: hypothetical protein VNM66_01960, partial [Thermodesulfobacteriota bacterium]|nr:hypothetical protein [Thermodesulfobacteriota bacterium]
MVTAAFRALRPFAPLAAAVGLLAGCATPGGRGPADKSPEQLRIESAPATEREALAAAQREAEAVAGAVERARREVERRALEVRL